MLVGFFGIFLLPKKDSYVFVVKAVLNSTDMRKKVEVKNTGECPFLNL